MSRKPRSALRRGWTTGACATAAAKAAFEALATGRFPERVTITLPGGETPAFALSRAQFEDGAARAGVVKDAGDDPDVTHGAEIIATVRSGAPGRGVAFHAGPGVGTVTLQGMPLPVGEAAINPVPRAMIEGAVAEVAAARGVPGDVAVTISIPGGEAMAAKTMNARLGIVGGLSVLGTTGIVIPYSCASWIHSIRSGVDVARAQGLEHIAGATGRTSEAGVARLHRLPELALIDMGDFAGGLLKYVRRKPVARLTIAGGFAKLSKLAAGRLDLHSSRSSVDVAALAEIMAGLDAPADAIEAARRASSAAQVLDAAEGHEVALADAVAARARGVALATLAGGTAVDVAVFDRGGGLIGHAG